MEILLLGAGCHLSDINMVTGWEQLQEMDVHLKFPYEDQLAENELKDFQSERGYKHWEEGPGATGGEVVTDLVTEGGGMVLVPDEQDLNFNVYSYFFHEFHEDNYLNNDISMTSTYVLRRTWTSVSTWAVTG